MIKKDYKSLKVFHFAEIIQKQIHKKNLSGMIFGNFGAQNMGDEAILSGELTELKKIPGVNIKVVSKNSAEIKRLHKTDAISLYNPFEIMVNLFKTDFVIVGGGGLICKPDRGILGVIFQLYTLLFYLALPMLIKKKIYVLGLGIYENANSLILKIATSLLKSVDILTVRDLHSFDLLKNHGVSAQIYKDNSFLMNQLNKGEIKNDSYFKTKYKENDYNLGLALLAPENKLDEEYLISELISLVRTKSKNTHYWFYACDYQKGFNNDLLFIHKIINHISEISESKINYSIVPVTLTPQKFFSSFLLMDFIISMRLHGSIFAFRNNVEFLGLTYDKKCTSFLASIGKLAVNLKSFRYKKDLLLNTI